MHTFLFHYTYSDDIHGDACGTMIANIFGWKSIVKVLDSNRTGNENAS